MSQPFSLSADQTLLTPIIKIPTGVPAPNTSFASVQSDPGRIYADGNRTIVLNACSEFVQETVPLRALDGAHKLRVLQDAINQPLLFTMGNDGRLYCTVAIENSTRGWKAFDITPAANNSGKVLTFDALQTISGSIALSTAFVDTTGQTSVYRSLLQPFSCTWDSVANRVAGFDAALPWHKITNELGSKDVSSITLAPAPTTGFPFQILVGTKASSDKVGSHFVVSPSPQIGQATWREVKVPETATVVVDTAPANVWEGPGIFTLYTRTDNSTGCTFDSLEKSFHYRMPLTDIGEARSITTNANPWNMTDLFVAGSNGIGFYNFSSIDLQPQLILPGKSFSQIVSSEAVDAQNPATQSKIVAFALSDSQELFYFEGTRPYADNVVKFTSSGYPIASGVQEISTQYNAKYDTSEIMYLGNNVNEVWRLTKPAGGLVWSSSQILVDASNGITTHPAYQTTLSFLEDDGKSIGKDYPVQISADTFVHASVNELSRSIGTQATTFLTDREGKIHISVPVDDTLGGPHYSITLTKFTATPKSFSVNSAQRVLRKLGEVKTGADLANATSTDGRKVFNETAEKYEDAGSILSNFSSMLSSADPATAKAVLKQPPTQTKDFSLGYKRNDDGSVTHDNGSWLENAIETVENGLADFLAWLHDNIKAVVKFAVKAVGRAVTFAFEVLGKVVKFVAKTVGTLVRGLAGFLKNYLGIDITGFLDWLSFIFDTEKAKQTQKILLDMYQGCRRMTIDCVDDNVAKLETTFTNSVDSLKKYIKDERPPAMKDAKNGFLKEISDSPVAKGLQWLFDNPVWKIISKFNPVNILLETLVESVSEELSGIGIQDSHAFDKLSKVITDFATKEFDNISRLAEDLKDRFSKVVKNGANFAQELSGLLGDALWTLLDAVKILVVSILDAVAAIVEGLFNTMDATWNLGWISDLFTEWADQPLTIINLVTMFAAQTLNIITLCTSGKLPGEVFGNPNEMYPLPTSKRSDSVVRTQRSTMTDSPVASSIMSFDTPVSIAQVKSQEDLKKEAKRMGEVYNFWSLLLTMGSTTFGCASSIVGAWNAITGDAWEKAIKKINGEGPTLETEMRPLSGADTDNIGPPVRPNANGTQGLIKPGAAGLAHLVLDLGQITTRAANLGLLSYYFDQKNPYFKDEVKYPEDRVGIPLSLLDNISKTTLKNTLTFFPPLQIAIQTVALTVNLVDCVYRTIISAPAIAAHVGNKASPPPAPLMEGIGDALQICVCILNLADNSFPFAKDKPDDKMFSNSDDSAVAGCSIASACFGIISGGASCAARKYENPYLVATIVLASVFDGVSASMAIIFGGRSLAVNYKLP
ncbi:hypothetical protein C1H76_6802 [Elsinoe australis]|uniref:Uncharacterized protein n=1 Tax=Elsinoe australis TaxID=40998 RepID=A0A4U7AW20_9PEZI|nr:hypothetical protein C1H76_6802 [Elsinoe australis]